MSANNLERTIFTGPACEPAYSTGPMITGSPTSLDLKPTPLACPRTPLSIKPQFPHLGVFSVASAAFTRGALMPSPGKAAH